ncbi:hypothetical protein K4L44_12670 [Halosquirtibacter laminarini]|uniref:Uncharacterized protein n=1 Tax=Halosquirtibacter laminarini TaxID=3374600 RepID=A0AC61ND21_9BACT|nr:hypothetical protein K4L44_12670 [Prolixibacteraceae bacterium]
MRRKMLKIFPDSIYLTIQYLYLNGAFLNLLRPQTFNEKLNWLKINDRTRLHTICADKVLVKEFVSEKIGEQYVIPTYHVIDKCSDLTIEKLSTKPCMVKANHDSGTTFCVDQFNLSENYFNHIKLTLESAMSQNYYWAGREWQYKDIKPKILIEELLESSDQEFLLDYKVFVFNGVAKFIQVDTDKPEFHKINLYDRNWEFVPVQIVYPNDMKLIERPVLLDKMLELSEVLAQPFKFVRIDWYISDNRLFVGEMTFHPSSGMVPFKPKSMNRLFGDCLDIQ